jgi:hypothetical protein
VSIDNYARGSNFTIRGAHNAIPIRDIIHVAQRRIKILFQKFYRPRSNVSCVVLDGTCLQIKSACCLVRLSPWDFLFELSKNNGAPPQAPNILTRNSLHEQCIYLYGFARNIHPSSHSIFSACSFILDYLQFSPLFKSIDNYLYITHPENQKSSHPTSISICRRSCSHSLPSSPSHRHCPQACTSGKNQRPNITDAQTVTWATSAQTHARFLH